MGRDPIRRRAAQQALQERYKAPIIYALIDPRTLLVRYVGQTKRGLLRIREHRHDPVTHPQLHVSRWVANLKNAGLQYTFDILETCTDDNALDIAEAWWITYGLASGWPLTNLTTGGSGAPGHTLSDEAREKISASKRGKPRPPEVRARLSEANTIAAANPEVRARMSAAAIARDPLTRRRGPMSAETRARMSASAIARDPSTRIRGPMSTEMRALLSVAHKGKPWSEKRRALFEARKKTT